MIALRTASMLRLWVLAWFLGSLGVAIASPIVHPQSFQVVCSAAGAVMVKVHTDDGSVEVAKIGMDCPLCSTPGAPPPVMVPELAAPASPLAHALQPSIAAHIAAISGAPLPARGPPSLS